MTVATAEAIHKAKTSLDALLDVTLRLWIDTEERAAFVARHAQIQEYLDTALYEATTPAALGCVLPRPSEDGTVPPASHD